MPMRLPNFVTLSAAAVLLVAASANTWAETPATKAMIKTYSLGKGARKPSGIAIGDVNNDGFLDLVTSNEATNNVSVLLGKGKGAFSKARIFPTDSQPRSIAMADFNQDGKLDVVTANFGSGTISVLFGNGDGTFQPPQNFSVGIQTQSVVVGDMNHDGIPDIVVASVQSENVDTFLSNGDGTFQPPKVFVFYNGYAGMTQIALGDMNHDGIVDIVGIYGYGQGFQVWAGNGDGTFYLYSNPLSYGTIAYPQGLALGDFNGDGRWDVAIGLYTENLVGVSKNEEHGNFSDAVGSTAPPATILLAAADLNGDGKLDVISTGLTTAVLDVGLGKGNGHFALSARYKTGTPPTAAAVGKLNRDNEPDIAFTTPNHVGVILR
jgi:FG-GAP-like repeat